MIWWETQPKLLASHVRVHRPMHPCGVNAASNERKLRFTTFHFNVWMSYDESDLEKLLLLSEQDRRKAALRVSVLPTKPDRGDLNRVHFEATAGSSTTIATDEAKLGP